MRQSGNKIIPSLGGRGQRGGGLLTISEYKVTSPHGERAHPDVHRGVSKPCPEPIERIMYTYFTR